MKWGRLTWDHRFQQMMLALYIPSLWSIVDFKLWYLNVSSGCVSTWIRDWIVPREVADCCEARWGAVQLVQDWSVAGRSRPSRSFRNFQHQTYGTEVVKILEFLIAVFVSFQWPTYLVCRSLTYSVIRQQNLRRHELISSTKADATRRSNNNTKNQEFSKGPILPTHKRLFYYEHLWWSGTLWHNFVEGCT